MVNNSYEHYRRGVNCYWNSMSLFVRAAWIRAYDF